MRCAFALAVTLCAGCDAIVDVAPQIDYVPFGDGDVDFAADHDASDGDGGDGQGDQDRDDGPRTSFVEAVTQAAPVAWYRFGREDLGSTVARDATTGGHPGSYVGESRPGAFGALAHDADTAATTASEVDGPINIPNVGVFTAAGATFTVSLWVNLHHTVYFDTVAGLFAVGSDEVGPSPAAAFRMLVGADQKVHVQLAGVDVFVGATALAPGRWTLVSVTRAVGGALKLYVDEALDGESLMSTMAVSDATAYLGGGRYPGSAHFDELMIFNRELGAAEISSFVRAGRDGTQEPASCGQTESPGDVFLEAQTIANHRFTSSVVIRASNLQLRNVLIEATGDGVFIDGADDVVLEDVAIVVTTSSDQPIGVRLRNSHRARLTRVRVIGAPRGVVVENSDDLVARFVVVREAMTRGATYPTVHVDSASSGAQLEDFEVVDFGATHTAPVSMAIENPDIFATRGLLAGNNALDSIGVRVATAGASSETALTDIDVTDHNYACLQVASCGDLLVAGLRCRDTRCNGEVPSDIGYAITVDAGVAGVIWESIYDDLCGPALGGTGSISTELDSAGFQARQRLNARFCWE
ncbi:MAG: LamG-like jellyroll fold domain-containing protein [Myxococcota bacterium]